MIFGDLAFYAGLVGIVIYVCVMAIRNTTQAARLGDGIRKYDERIAILQARLEELKQARQEVSPEVDDLLTRLLALRQTRDGLVLELEEMEQRIREREIRIGTRAH